MKTIRTWVYAILEYQDKIITIQKTRWPFNGMLDMPWGKIEHYEKHLDGLKREIFEETGIWEENFEIIELVWVDEEFVEHIWEWQEKQEHILAIIYRVKIVWENINLDFIEQNGDAWGLVLIEKNDKIHKKTPILERVLEKIFFK